MPLRRHNSAVLSSPRTPSSTMRIFSSAENWRRVARRISLRAASTGALAGPDVVFIFALYGNDAEELGLAAGRGLARHKPEPSGHVAPAREGRRVADRGTERGGVDRTHAR